MKNPATSTGATGTGPFKLAEWKRGDYVRLSKNSNYFKEGKPYLDEVVFKPRVFVVFIIVASNENVDYGAGANQRMPLRTEILHQQHLRGRRQRS